MSFISLTGKEKIRMPSLPVPQGRRRAKEDKEYESASQSSTHSAPCGISSAPPDSSREGNIVLPKGQRYKTKNWSNVL